MGYMKEEKKTVTAQHIEKAKQIRQKWEAIHEAKKRPVVALNVAKSKALREKHVKKTAKKKTPVKHTKLAKLVRSTPAE